MRIHVFARAHRFRKSFKQKEMRRVRVRVHVHRTVRTSFAALTVRSSDCIVTYLLEFGSLKAVHIIGSWQGTSLTSLQSMESGGFGVLGVASCYTYGR